jgi:hypothetical protein
MLTPVHRPLERPAERDYGAEQPNLQGKGAFMSRSKTILALTIVLLVVWSNTALGSNGDPLTLGQANGATAGTTLSVKLKGAIDGLKVAVGATTGAAVLGQTSGAGSGLSGTASNANGFGATGSNTAVAHGSGAGGSFVGNHDTGVIGTSVDATSYGVWGRNTSGDAVYGQATGLGRGVHGRASDGIGVFGESGGASAGVAGRSSSGDGVTGTAQSGNGVHGTTQSFDSGVLGENTSGHGSGIAGRAGSAGMAVFGDNTGTGWAGYFADKVFVGGNLALGGSLQCAGCVSGAAVGKVSDSDQLDGIDSTGFIQGTGRADRQAIAIGPGDEVALGDALLGFLLLSYRCPVNQSDAGALTITNVSGDLANVFVEFGGPNPRYFQMLDGDSQQLGAVPTGDAFHIQAQGALGVMTVDVATVNRVDDCHAQAQALLT